jgi:hypothetical protein
MKEQGGWWLGYKEAAELCGVCVQTIRNHERKRAFRSRWFRNLGLHGGRLIEHKSLMEWHSARKGLDELIEEAPDRPGQTVHGPPELVGQGTPASFVTVTADPPADEDDQRAERIESLLISSRGLLLSIETLLGRMHDWQMGVELAQKNGGGE